MQQHLDKSDVTAQHNASRVDLAQLRPRQLLRQLVRRVQWVNFSPTLAKASATCVDRVSFQQLKAQQAAKRALSVRRGVMAIQIRHLVSHSVAIVRRVNSRVYKVPCIAKNVRLVLLLRASGRATVQNLVRVHSANSAS